MDILQAPTKSNLINAKNSLKIAAQGYDLLDRKRKLLLRELNGLQDKARGLRAQLEETFKDAYAALREANINLGIDNVESLAEGVAEDKSIDIKFYSVMGVEIPIIRADSSTKTKPAMSLYKTNLSLDEARFCFNKAKKIVIELSELENGIKRLSLNIGKTQKRANSLKNIMIPRYTALIAIISETLEEKEREEFARLKVIKVRKG